MLEFLSIPLIAGAGVAIFGRKKEHQDKQTIQHVFKNLKVGAFVGEEFVYPKLVGEDDLGNGTKYVYQTALGLPDKTLKPLQEILKATLAKPLKVEFDQWLEISVYDEPIPKKVLYKDVPSKEGWKVPLGKNETGWLFHDFDKTPMATIAGTTRFGKTVMLKNMMTYLIEHHTDDVEFLIIDLKGGLEFDKYKNLKQVLEVCSNPHEAFNALRLLHEYMDGEMARFKKKGWSNIVHTPIQKRLFVIVDEGAQLAPDKFMDRDQKNMLAASQHILSEIARIGGALGVRLIFCTQYPTSDTLPRQIKQNSDLKITYRLPSGYASEVAIDDYGAEKLPSDVPGRALIKTHELREVQSPFIDDKEMWKRVRKYVVNKQREETKEGGTDFIQLG